MGYELTPQTAAGERLTAAAQALQPAFEARAAAADHDGQPAADNFRDLQRSGIAAAFVPEALGGWGLTSIHDWIVGIAALARADGSTAIAINMHLGVSRGMALGWHAARAAGGSGDGAAAPLQAIAAGEMLICATATERGHDNLHPHTEAVPEADSDGSFCRINGHKLFVTLSPLATHLGMNLRLRDARGDHLVTTLLPMDSPGLLPQDDWDALGMRASGSQSVRFDDVRVPRAALRRIGPWGRWSVPMLVNRTLANLPLVAAFLGMAERARELAIQAAGSNRRDGVPVRTLAGVQHLVAEIEIELATCRSVLQRAATSLDAFVARSADHAPDLEAAHTIMQEYQVAKSVVNRGAIDIVGKALDVVGGQGYMSRHPLSRLYRDVRAGPFMQPGAPAEARDYIGRVALGLYPFA